MNLETALEPRLWNAVRTSIEARKYTSAVLDGIHLLTDVIRDRSGLEGDGVALIGGAFGGSSPKLKVNRLQTESEQNVQRGMEALLRGLYQAVRNPRSHDSFQDTERDANALLLFVDYLLRVVDKSGSPFSLSAIVERIIDPYFVPSERYATLLVGEIPDKKRLAACLELFARRSETDRDKVRYLFDAILEQMQLDDITEFCGVISQELRETTDEETIRFVLGAFPSAIWAKLDEVARLRIENKLIASVKEGKFTKRLERCTGGALGTWLCRILGELTLKEKFWRTVFAKLGSTDVSEQDYAFNYFASGIIKHFPTPPESLTNIVLHGLKDGDRRFKDLADGWQSVGHDEMRKLEDPWRVPFLYALANFIETPATQEAESSETGDDRIPF